MGAIMRAQCRHFCVFSDRMAQSHIVDARSTYLKLIIFLLCVGRALALVTGSWLELHLLYAYFCARSNRQRKLGMFKILSAYERINVHASRQPQTHSLEQRYIKPRPSPTARATGCDYVISAACYFCSFYPWSSEERHFIYNLLKWCFTRYTA